MQIFVKTLTGKTVTFDVEGQRHHRQREIKEKHSSRPAAIDLRGKQLEDGKTLSDCNVQKERSVLQDIMRTCNEVNCMVKKLDVEPLSRRDDGTQEPV